MTSYTIYAIWVISISIWYRIYCFTPSFKQLLIVSIPAFPVISIRNNHANSDTKALMSGFVRDMCAFLYTIATTASWNETETYMLHWKMITSWVEVYPYPHSIPRLRMEWRRKEPVHRQPRYCREYPNIWDLTYHGLNEFWSSQNSQSPFSQPICYVVSFSAGHPFWHDNTLVFTGAVCNIPTT